MGTIKEKVNKDIQAQRSKGLIEKSKIDQAFAKYNLNVDEQEVKEAVKKIIAEKVPENDTIDVKKFLLGSVEPDQSSHHRHRGKHPFNGRKGKQVRRHLSRPAPRGHHRHLS